MPCLNGTLIMNHKFGYEVVSRQIINFDYDRLKEAMMLHRYGEVLVRDKIEWDYDQMRKFLHGPVTDFMIAMFKQHNGMVFRKLEMHKWLRDGFLPGAPKEVAGKLIAQPVSSETIGKEGYIKWLKNINDWCMDAWQCDLPPAESVE